METNAAAQPLFNLAIDGNILKIGFGAPAQNPEIVKYVKARLAEMAESGELAGGPALKLNGPASLPVALVIGHAVSHLYGAVACFDPKVTPGYVVVVSHDPAYAVGDQIE